VHAREQLVERLPRLRLLVGAQLGDLLARALQSLLCRGRRKVDGLRTKLHHAA
jgi:hypothetical protein